MKSIKAIGLVALAALMAMALVGVSSAMAKTATALCKVDEVPCKAANLATHVHEETLVGQLAELLTELEPIKCDVLFLGTVLALGKETNKKGVFESQVIHGNFTYTNCTRGEEKCTATEVNPDSLLEILRTAHERADVTGEGEVRLKCGFFIDCTYNGEELKGDALGLLLSKETWGETLLEDQEVKKVAGSFVCPVKGKLDILTAALEELAVHISE